MAAEEPPSPQSAMRFALLDQARGLALVAMIVYHAIWDGLLYGLVPWTPALDETMRTAAQIIASSFLLIVGVSAALAHEASSVPLLRRPAAWRRIGFVAAGAVLVSLATTFALPAAPIYFGILHHITLASIILAVIAPHHPFFAVTLAALVSISHASFASAAFNHPALIWLGFGTVAPVTADWVPMAPWLTASLLGFALGKHILVPWLRSRPPQERQGMSFGRDPLSFMGRHSLAIYLVHQPILIGLILAYLAVTQA